MEKSISAGLVMYRWNCGKLELLLGHPGGPLYTHKDDGFWGIPKGHVEQNEAVLAAAFREFSEETGIRPPVDNLISLGKLSEHKDKDVFAWAFHGSFDTIHFKSNLFAMEWPPNSGRIEHFPEFDQISFFDALTARQKIEPFQRQFIERLERRVFMLDGSKYLRISAS